MVNNCQEEGEIPGRDTRNTTYRCFLPDLAGLRNINAIPSRQSESYPLAPSDATPTFIRLRPACPSM